MMIVVHITPIPKQSARFSSRGGRVFAHKEKRIIEYEKELERQIKECVPSDHELWNGTIFINKLEFVFPHLKSIKKKDLLFLKKGGQLAKTTKPDLDNLCKPLFDAMEGIVFTNDSRICEINGLSKVYGIDPKIIIDIEVVDYD